MIDLGVVVHMLTPLTEEQAKEVGFGPLTIKVTDQVVTHQPPPRFRLYEV